MFIVHRACNLLFYLYDYNKYINMCKQYIILFFMVVSEKDNVFKVLKINVLRMNGST